MEFGIESERLEKSKFNRQYIITSKLSQPKGCCQTSKPKTSDIDLEIFESRKREEAFDNKIKVEMAKLNFPIASPEKMMGTRRSKRLNTHAIGSESPEKNIRRVQTVSPRNNPRQTKNCPSSAVKTLFNDQQTLLTESLPPLIKSTPMHLDPALKFPKKKSPGTPINYREKRISTLNSLMNKCTSPVSTTCKFIDTGIKSLGQNTQKFSSLLDKVLDSIKFGAANETLQTVKISDRDDKRLFKKLTLQSNKLRDELNASGVKIMGNSQGKRKTRTLSLD